MSQTGLPPRQGLYDPQYEHDACGVGFIVDVHGRKSHDIVQKGIGILVNLAHRGACGCENNTGDGAGILLQMPHRFLERECGRLKIELPPAGGYGTGVVFLPSNADDRRRCEQIFEEVVREEGQKFLGWRDVPTSNAPIGPTARGTEPVMRQPFIQAHGLPPVGVGVNEDGLAFERKLYVIRRRVENAVKTSDIAQRGMFYVPSLSFKTLVYKGMLISTQLEDYLR